MRFIIDGDERYNTIEIHVLIVEDSFEQARNIKSSIEGYESLFNGKRDIFRNDIKVLYKVLINGKIDYPENEFISETAFANSLQYLKENGNVVDIILCDFDLGNSKGNEFFIQAKNIEEGGNFRWYNVLHSIGWEYQKYQNTGIADLTLDSKNKEAVHEVILKTFEEKILKSILFGNPGQYELFYITYLNLDFKLNNDIQLYCGMHNERILTVCSHPKLGKKFTVFYLNEDYSISEIISEEPLTPLKESRYFNTISRSLIINKLWIGDFDIINNRIKFIRSSNSQFTFDIDRFFGGKSKKSHIVEYLYSLISAKKLKSSEEFQAPHAYFHFT